MRYSGILFAAFLLPFFSGSLGAQETGRPACGTFKVLGTVETRTFIDLGDVGPTGGDQRVGRYTLSDDDGNDLGVMHFSSIVMPPRGRAESPLMTTLHFAFDNGSLVAVSVIGLPSPADTGSGPDEDLEYAVTGGSGDFARASGTLTTRTLDDDRRQMSFDVDCGR